MSTESSHQSRRLDVLLVDYEASRDDDRQQQVQIAALFGVGATLLAALYAIVLQAAPFNSATTALRLNPVIIFFLPMIPLILLAYTIWFSAGISLRGYYLRALEREISAQAGTTVELHGQLPVPSLAHLEVLLFRTGPGGPARMRLISNLVGLVSFVGLCGGASLCLLALRPWVVQLAFILVYVPIIMIVFWVAWTTSIKPRRFFHSLYDRFAGEFADPLDSLRPARPAGQRRLASYLIVPRLGELLKSSLYFFFAALALLTYGSTSVRSVLIYWIIFELLGYQARYAWNDLRDLTREHSHPGRNARGRIPEVGTVLFRIIIVETMIVARIGFAIALLWLLPAGVERYVGAYLLIALTILSICYEAIRSRTSKVRSGRFHLLEWMVYIAIALGYGLRGSAGFWYGSAGSARLATLVIVFLTCSALGAAGVLVLWLYEADMLARESGMHIIPSHLALLLRVFNRSKKAVHAAPPKGGSLLARRDLTFSPWGAFLLTAAGLSGLLGADLWAVRTDLYGSYGAHPLPLLLGLIAGLTLGYVTQHVPVVISFIITAGGCAIGLLCLLSYGIAAAAVAVAVLPTFICLSSYLTMRMGTYEQLAEGLLYFLKLIKLGLPAMLYGFQRLILGRNTMDAVNKELRAIGARRRSN